MIKHSKKCSALVAVFLVISLMTTLLLSETSIKAAVLSSKYFYLYLEKDNFKEITKKYKEYYKENYLSERSYEYKASAKLDGDLMKYDEEMKTFADYLSKFEFKYNYNFNNKDVKDSYYSLFLGAKYDNKDFVDVDIKSADKKAIITFPSLTDKALGIDNTSTYEISANFINAFLDDDKAFKELFGVSRDTYDNMVERYLKNVIFDQIPDDKVVFRSDTNFEDIKCNSITFNIDKEVIANIYKAVAKELESDKDIRNMCNSVSNSFIDLAKLQEQEIDIDKPTADEIDEEIKSICDDLYEASENVDDIQVEYTAFFKDNGDILSRQFVEKESDTDVAFSTFKDSLGNDTISLKVKENKKSIFEMKNQTKLQNGFYNGECNIDVSEKNLFKANYTYEKDAKVGNIDSFVGSIQGKIKLEQFKDDSEFNNLNGLNDIYFSFNNKREDNNTLKGRSAFTSKVDGKRIGITLFTEVKQLNAANIAKPKVSLDNAIMLDDETGLAEFADDIGESIQEKIIGVLLSGSSEEEYLD